MLYGMPFMRAGSLASINFRLALPHFKFRVGRATPRMSVAALSSHVTDAQTQIRPSDHGVEESRQLLTTPAWHSLGVGPEELTLDFCLPTGQSFRWHQEAPGTFIGVVGQRLVRMRQTPSDCEYTVLARGEDAYPDQDDLAVREYLNLPRDGGTGVSLTELGAEWSKACKRYAHIRAYIPGARMLRQHPVECLFEFICSSNNNIARIHGMVQHLCETYGTPLVPLVPLDDTAAPADVKGEDKEVQPGGAQGTPVAVLDVQQIMSNGVSGTTVASPPGEDPDQALPHRQKRRRSRSPTALHPVAVGMSVEPDVAVGNQAPLTNQAPVLGVEVDATTSQPLQQPLLMGESQQGSPQGDPSHDGSPQAMLTPTGRTRGQKGSKTASMAAPDPPAVSPRGVQGDDEAPPSSGRSGRAARKQSSKSPVRAMPRVYYAFPTLEQLTRATDEDLRAAGFGYRAKFIVGTVQALASKPEGGDAWLMGLRERSYEEAAASLAELPGVGPKVAACVCLFSLDKHEAIPVDTHVWQIATQYYLPSLRGKALTKKVHADVQQAFVQRFGPYAGWAHNAMFISELAAHKQRIPPHLKE